MMLDVLAEEETEIGILSEREKQLLANHEQAIQQAKDGGNTFYEHEFLLELKASSPTELIRQGYNLSEITEIKNLDVERVMLDEIYRRAELDESTLERMGYVKEEIAQLKNFNGTETLSEVAPFALAQVTCYNKLNPNGYYFKTSENKTYFIVDFGWS